MPTKTRFWVIKVPSIEYKYLLFTVSNKDDTLILCNFLQHEKLAANI